jgi:hypothetical protein
MGVNLSPGRSGNRSDATAPVPSSGKSQPVPITTTNAADRANYPTCKSTTPARDRGDCVMPTGGGNPIEGGAT